MIAIAVKNINSPEKIGGDGYHVLFASAICSFLMFIILLYQRKFVWTLLEKIIVSLITICGLIWVIKGAYNATIFGIISEAIVGIYLIIKTIERPVVKYNLAGYTLFLIACIVAVFNADHWTLEDIGYNLSEIVITSITIIPLLIKWRKER